MTLKYVNDTSLFHSFGLGRRVEVDSGVWINPDLTKDERNASYLLRQQRRMSSSIIKSFLLIQMFLLSIRKVKKMLAGARLMLLILPQLKFHL